MTLEKILAELKKQQFRPVYWLEGEEEFFIDQVIEYAEKNILSESEASFNLTIFYGRDTSWPDLFNACRKYPMFSDKQVVILKEAQAMKDVEKLENYVEKPLSSTLLFVAYKGKKVDGRTKLAKLLKDKAVLLTSKKLYDNELPEWTSDLIKTKGFSITNKALFLLIDHIGNDLSRLDNEVNKLILNLDKRKNITEDDVEMFVGISKEFNVFELQQAIANKDLYKAIQELTKKVQQMGNRNYRNNSSNNNYRNPQQQTMRQQQFGDRQSRVVCYSCGQPGHIVRTCPNRNNNTTSIVNTDAVPQVPNIVNPNNNGNNQLTQIQQMLAQLIPQENDENQSLN